MIILASMEKEAPSSKENDILVKGIKVDIATMKRHLKSLRKIAGWTAEELGEKIGLTTQTINGLENNPKTNLSQAQYIAFRAIFEAEAAYSKNENLKNILLILFDPYVYDSFQVDIDDAINVIKFSDTLANSGKLGKMALEYIMKNAFKQPLAIAKETAASKEGVEGLIARLEALATKERLEALATEEARLEAAATENAASIGGTVAMSAIAPILPFAAAITFITTQILPLGKKDKTAKNATRVNRGKKKEAAKDSTPVNEEK